MRITTATVATVAAVFMLAASGVYAQPVRTEGPTSPFTYEALGATPTIQLRRAGADRKVVAEKPAANDAASRGRNEAAPAEAGKPATAQAAVRSTSQTH